jgi:hypothetical protein
MTIARKTLEIATFWDQEVCLDCETIQPPEGEQDPEATCVSCGSGNILAAEAILAIADLVDGEEE